MPILLVEDDPETAAAVCAVAAGAGLAIEHAADGETGLRRAGDPAFELLILDRMLPDADGLELLERMRAAGVATPVLMLSALGRWDQRVLGLDRGADDYLAKPFEPDELVARIRALLRRRDRVSCQAILFHGDIELHVGARTAHRRGRHLGLSPKEFEVLHYLMSHAGEIVTRDMLLRHVWQLNFDPQTNVIDVNLVRLRRKLETEGEAACLQTVRGRGYRLVAP